MEYMQYCTVFSAKTFLTNRVHAVLYLLLAKTHATNGALSTEELPPYP